MKMTVCIVKKGQMRKFGRKSYYLSFSINTFIFSLLILKIFANQNNKSTKIQKHLKMGLEMSASSFLPVAHGCASQLLSDKYTLM